MYRALESKSKELFSFIKLLPIEFIWNSIMAYTFTLLAMEKE